MEPQSKNGALQSVRNLSDRELWARARSEPEAYSVLFERHARSVYNFCFRRTADWATAEDLVSDVFLETWRRREQVEITSSADSLLPWLLGVATNMLRRRARASRRLKHALSRLSPNKDEPDPAEDTVARLADEQRMREVLDLVEKLPAHELDVVALYYWAGLDYRGVAQALDLPIGTVRSRLSRARASLRERLAPSGHIPLERPTTSKGVR